MMAPMVDFLERLAKRAGNMLFTQNGGMFKIDGDSNPIYQSKLYSTNNL